MLSTFKGKLVMLNPLNPLGQKLLPDGLMWHDQIGNPELPTVDTTNELFEFTKDEVLFSSAQIKKYGEGLCLDPLDTKFKDEIKYTLHKRYQRGKPIYEIKIDQYYLTIVLSWMDKFKLNVIHNRYWLFNEKKWFATFSLSLAAFVLALVALLIKSC